MVLILVEYGKIDTCEHFGFCTFSVPKFQHITSLILVILLITKWTPLYYYYPKSKSISKPGPQTLPKPNHKTGPTPFNTSHPGL